MVYCGVVGGEINASEQLRRDAKERYTTCYNVYAIYPLPTLCIIDNLFMVTQAVLGFGVQENINGREEC